MHIVPPTRVARTYRQHLMAPPDKVFPLLCPVREVDWVRRWQPNAVYCYSGLAEPDGVFTTPDRDTEAVWIITRHEPDRFFLELVKVTPGWTVATIRIALTLEDHDTTTAVVTYMLTALTAQGEAAVEAFTEASYHTFMQDWEDELNHYLRTGEKLEDDAG